MELLTLRNNGRLFGYIAVTLAITLLTNGCAGVSQGRPNRPKYQDEITKALVRKYSRIDFTRSDSLKITTKEQRNAILDDLLYLTDINFSNFLQQLYQGRATFDTISDLAILGLGSAGALTPAASTKAILAAISGGLAGSRVSINKNFFHEQATQALTAKMKAARKQKLESIRKGMQLDLNAYSLAHGLTDLAEYYDAGTLLGAFESIVQDAGADAKKADDAIKKIITIKYDKTVAAEPARQRINAWLAKNPKDNVPALQTWLQNQTPPISITPGFWADDPQTPEETLKQAIDRFHVP